MVFIKGLASCRRHRSSVLSILRIASMSKWQPELGPWERGGSLINPLPCLHPQDRRRWAGRASPQSVLSQAQTSAAQPQGSAHLDGPCPQALRSGSQFTAISSVQFSHSVMSNSLQPHESQHARRWPPCPSPTPGVYPNPCPSSRLCHPAISSSVIPFSSCPQSLSASGSFPMSQLFA